MNFMNITTILAVGVTPEVNSQSRHRHTRRATAHLQYIITHTLQEKEQNNA